MRAAGVDVLLVGIDMKMELEDAACASIVSSNTNKSSSSLLLLLLLLQMELEDAGHIVQVQEVFLAVL